MGAAAKAPGVTRGDIEAGLRRLGLTAGAGVMVHSSLNSFGRVVGGAATVVEALMEVITPAGTLMLPSFNHGHAFVRGAPGYFDPRRTPTTNGAIPNAFWQMPGVFRSLHPTHSFAAWGRHARRYTAYHHRTLTAGPDSPLGLLGREGGYGVLLGVGYRANTFHHVVEMTTGAPCLGRRTQSYPMLLPDGRTVEGRGWGWRAGSCPLTDRLLYEGRMRARGLETATTIGTCRAALFGLADCFHVIAEMLGNGADDFPPCSACPVRPRRDERTVPADWDDRRQCLRPESSAWDY